MGVLARGSIIGLLGVSVGLAGCLFPSFDGLDKGAGDNGNGDDHKNGNDKGSTSPSAEQTSAQTTNDGTSSPTSSSSGGSTQGGASGAPHPSTNKIACGKSACDSKTQFCCPAWNDATCEPTSKQGFCQSVVRCDGPEDCGVGSQCCVPMGSIESKCSTGCTDGRILCHPETSGGCPGTMKCTGAHRHNDVLTNHFCE